MKFGHTQGGLAPAFFLMISLTLGPDAFGGMDSWTNSSSGLWRTASNWSSNQAPDATFSSILITNDITKTVTIDSATPSTNLAVVKLILSAPAGATNALLLTDLTTNQPLQLTGTLRIESGGALGISNSALTIDGTLGAIFDVVAGSVELDSGLIDCRTATVARFGRTNNATAGLTINGGTMLPNELLFGTTVSHSQGSLDLSNGVLNCGSLLSVGEVTGSTGMVSVAGGQLIVTNDITKVGNSGFGQMTLSGGSASFAFLAVAENPGSSGTIFMNGGQLTLLPRTTNDWQVVGNLGTGQLLMSGGTNLVLSAFHIADNLNSTGLVTVTGGRLIATNDTLSLGRYGTGQMTISNAPVLVTNVSVGRHDGAVGTLTLQSNAVLTQLDDLSIARFSNSVGHVLIEGGLLSLTNSFIWVGRGGAGDMTMSNGTAQARSGFVATSTVEPDPASGLLVTNAPTGTLTLAGGSLILSSNLLVGTASIATGQVFVVGGNLTVTNGANAGYVSVASGSLTLNAGNVTADSLVLTNSTGQMIFNGGTLQTRSMSVANGLPFVVGDGLDAATLQLEGGVYSFANGLVVSSNATVTGCGTILGSITNHGTLATNCGPSITIIRIVKAGSVVTLSYTTISGSNHVVQYSATPATNSWTSILPGVFGDGSVMSQTDTNATAPARFYRILLQ